MASINGPPSGNNLATNLHKMKLAEFGTSGILGESPQFGSVKMVDRPNTTPVGQDRASQ